MTRMLKTAIRVAATLAAFVVTLFLLGVVKMAFQPATFWGGGFYGLLSMAILFGIPYAAWRLTGQTKEAAKIKDRTE